MTGLARATVDRKLAKGDRLSQNESERLVGFAELVGQAQTMVRESGNARAFNAAHWMAEWLEQPHPALGGQKPGDLYAAVSASLACLETLVHLTGARGLPLNSIVIS